MKPLPRLRRLVLLLLLATVIAAPPGCGPRKPAPLTPEMLPRYGDPGRRTIWDATPPEARGELYAQSIRAADRGWARLVQGQIDAAVPALNRAWSLDPGNRRALWGLATAQFERARGASATKEGVTPAVLAMMDEAVGLMRDALAAGGGGDPPVALVTDAAYVRATRGHLRQTLGVGGSDDDYAAAQAMLQRAEAAGPSRVVYEAWAKLETYRGYPRKAAVYEARAREVGRSGEADATRPAAE